VTSRPVPPQSPGATQNGAPRDFKKLLCLYQLKAEILSQNSATINKRGNSAVTEIVTDLIILKTVVIALFECVFPLLDVGGHDMNQKQGMGL
jgi:hypothetical protein